MRKRKRVFTKRMLSVLFISLFAIKKRTLRVRLFFYFLEEQGKEAGTYDGHDAGYADGKGTH